MAKNVVLKKKHKLHYREMSYEFMNTRKKKDSRLFRDATALMDIKLLFTSTEQLSLFSIPVRKCRDIIFKGIGELGHLYTDL
jgi:hypothetical protein